MKEVYNKSVTDFKQPLITVKHSDGFIYLPPEFCRIDGVPESIRASPAMRDCLAICRIDPNQKMREIHDVVGLLMQQQIFRDWNVSINSAPIEMRNQTILAEPMIFKENQIIHVNENVLRRLKI